MRFRFCKNMKGLRKRKQLIIFFGDTERIDFFRVETKRIDSLRFLKIPFLDHLLKPNTHSSPFLKFRFRKFL